MRDKEVRVRRSRRDKVKDKQFTECVRAGRARCLHRNYKKTEDGKRHFKNRQWVWERRCRGDGRHRRGAEIRGERKQGARGTLTSYFP